MEDLLKFEFISLKILIFVWICLQNILQKNDKFEIAKYGDSSEI